MALGKCLECGGIVSSDAAACPHCGKVFRKPAAQTSGCTMVAAWAIGIFLGLAILIQLMRESGVVETPKVSPQQAAQDRADREALDACYTAWQVVRGLLKSPTSAEFGNCQTGEDVSVVDRGGGLYFVTGAVDADNAFGAKLRSNYIVQLQKGPGKGEWKVVEAKLLE